MRKNHREKILGTARQLLPKHGYNGVSIRAIADKAKLSTGAIYFHFRDKKEIYKAVCIEAIELLIKKFSDSISRRKTPGQKLISTFDSYIDFFYENRDHYNILMEYRANFRPMEDSENFEIMKKMYEMNKLMEQTIRDGIAQRVFRELDPRMLALLLAAVAEGMLQLKKLGMFEYLNIKDADFRRFMAEITGKGILSERSEDTGKKKSAK